MSRDDEKDGISGSIQNQKAILEKYASDNRLPNPRFFYDNGYSGVTFTRPAFMEIMELAEQGLVVNFVDESPLKIGPETALWWVSFWKKILPAECAVHRYHG